MAVEAQPSLQLFHLSECLSLPCFIYRLICAVVPGNGSESVQSEVCVQWQDMAS